MTAFYIGVQNKLGMDDTPPYVGNSSDGAGVDVELNFNGTAIPDLTSALPLVEKLKLFLTTCPWPPSNQAL